MAGMQTSAYPPNIHLTPYDAERLRIRAPITTAIKPRPTPSQVKDNPEDGRLVVGTGVAVAVGTTGIAVAYTAVGNAAGAEVGSLVELGATTVTGGFVRVAVVGAGVLVRVAVGSTGVFVRVGVTGVFVNDGWGVGVSRTCSAGSAIPTTGLWGGRKAKAPTSKLKRTSPNKSVRPLGCFMYMLHSGDPSFQAST